MADEQLVASQAAIAAAVRSGALIEYRVSLGEGEWAERSLWLRPDLIRLVSSNQLETAQRDVVKAALRRFVIGGPFNVVKADSPHREVLRLGDIRELKGPAPPFVELRFKPPKYDLRFFGRFIRKDGLILTGFGMKSPEGAKGERPWTVAEQRRRGDAFFQSQGLELKGVPARIEDSLTNATFA